MGATNEADILIRVFVHSNQVSGNMLKYAKSYLINSAYSGFSGLSRGEHILPVRP